MLTEQRCASLNMPDLIWNRKLNLGGPVIIPEKEHMYLLCNLFFFFFSLLFFSCPGDLGVSTQQSGAAQVGARLESESLGLGQLGCDLRATSHPGLLLLSAWRVESPPLAPGSHECEGG